MPDQGVKIPAAFLMAVSEISSFQLPRVSESPISRNLPPLYPDRFPGSPWSRKPSARYPERVSVKGVHGHRHTRS